MKLGFYCRLAAINLRNNKRTYLPYLLSCTSMVMMFYIIHSLAIHPMLEQMEGGAQIRILLNMAVGVVGFFAAIFLFYTNSFLIKRRKREFGMFNVLGMQKGHIARVLFWENLLVGAVSLGAGIAFGMLFSKLVQALLLRILHFQVPLSFQWMPESCRVTAVLFFAIHLVLFLCGVRQIHLANPVALLRGAQAGEKPPKANWPMALLGVLTLGAGYYIAVTVQNPMAALLLFFVAVILVIIGTFCCFTAGSVALLRLLQKNKAYYYKTAHFVSVSGMIARMRRNGAGLASICILSTAVLVMISSTVSLYLGSEDALREHYPRNITASCYDASPALEQQLDQAVTQTLESQKIEPSNELSMHLLAFAARQRADTMDLQAIVQMDDLTVTGDVRQLTWMPLSDYCRLSGQSLSLAQDEAILFAPDGGYGQDRLNLPGFGAFKIVQTLDRLDGAQLNPYMGVSTYYLIVCDEQMAALDAYQSQIFGAHRSKCQYLRGFDVTDAAAQQQVFQALCDAVGEAQITVRSDQEGRATFYSLYGGLFFLGLFLGALFLFATVLILYYKQVTEGYEDQSRFEIMRKVGMTRHEIKKTIHSQTVTVFFLPLITAGVHICFAFPVISKLLALLSLHNMRLFALGSLGTFGVFAVFYLVMYHWTSGAYYGIVSKN